MAVKLVEVAEVGQVAMYKRRGVRGVKLSLTHDGGVRVTLPTWAPYRLGIEFVRNKSEWIIQKRQPKHFIQDGDRVGKAHRFVFELKPTGQPASRLKGTDIHLTFSATHPADSIEVQQTAQKAAIRALKKEAEQLLPQRLATLADQNGFSYRSVTVKRLKSRWGSCNEHKDVVLNCFLMQLPWHLIDYVLLHELTHTKVLRHGEPFWNELALYVKDLKTIRKEMKQHQPTLMTQPGMRTSDPSSSQPLDIAIETA